MATARNAVVRLSNSFMGYAPACGFIDPQRRFVRRSNPLIYQNGLTQFLNGPTWLRLTQPCRFTVSLRAEHPFEDRADMLQMIAEIELILEFFMA